MFYVHAGTVFLSIPSGHIHAVMQCIVQQLHIFPMNYSEQYRLAALCCQHLAQITVKIQSWKIWKRNITELLQTESENGSSLCVVVCWK